MARPLQIAVIADDLTGAADTGVQFCPVVGPVHLTSARDGDLDLGGITTGGMAVSTSSRHLDAAAAGKKVRLVWAKVRQLAPEIIYKKIDSSLRGNLGAEIDALSQETQAAASFVAPAFPQQGRITENDTHTVDGVPVAETEFSRDPRCPVNESRLSVLLSDQSRMGVGHVDIGCIEQGQTAMAARVGELLDRDCRHIAFDAAGNRHLDSIVSLAFNHFSDRKIVLAGSAGLAGSLARHMARESDPYPVAARPGITAWLFVCGSASRIMAGQIASLIRQTEWHRLVLDPSILAAGDTDNRQHMHDCWLEACRSGSGMVLSISPGDGKSGNGENPALVIGGMARTAAGLMAASPPGGLFLSGGDTAEAVLDEIGAEGVLLFENIVPGLMRGEIAGGTFNGLPVVTKAGAFGTVDTLNRLIKILE